MCLCRYVSIHCVCESGRTTVLTFAGPYSAHTSGPLGHAPSLSDPAALMWKLVGARWVSFSALMSTVAAVLVCLHLRQPLV